MIFTADFSLNLRRVAATLFEMNLKIVLEHGEDGYFVAHCPSLKSCWSQGKTREEALQNIREAIDLYLEPSSAELSLNDEREVVDMMV